MKENKFFENYGKYWVVTGVVAVVFAALVSLTDYFFDGFWGFVLILFLATISFLAFTRVTSKFSKQQGKETISDRKFVDMMSHELKNPMSAIKWQLDALLDKRGGNHKNDEDYRDLLAIEEYNERMIRLANDLLEIHRFENDKLIFNRVIFSMVDLVREVITHYNERAEFARVRVEFFPPLGNVTVYSDPTKVSAVVSHLIDNAIRFTPAGKHVRVSLEKEEKKIRLSVEDEGIGICEEEKEKIFQKYFRGEKSKQYKKEGVGVGLYLVKSIITALGGEVGFTGAEDKGATFWLILPAE